MIYGILRCNQFIIPSKATACDTSCITINDFAVQAEMVAVETSIYVGYILWIFYDYLYLTVSMNGIMNKYTETYIHLTSGLVLGQADVTVVELGVSEELVHSGREALITFTCRVHGDYKSKCLHLSYLYIPA